MVTNAPDARLRMRNPVPGPKGGGLYLSELQRTRLLDAAFAIVCEEGYRGMAVRAVAERAGVSSKTFYDLFEDREACFLAAFDHGVEQLTEVARPAYAAQEDWAAGLRAGLGALLAFLDDEPALSKLVFVEALGAGPRVLARRAEVLDRVAGLLDEGRAGMEAAGELPALTGAGVVGATFSMVHARLIEPDAAPLTGLLNELMATIVLPYRGREAAAHELSRPAPERPAGAVRPEPVRPEGLKAPHDFRLTVRRHAALSAVAELCAQGREPSNREVCGQIGLADQSQVSRLMMGLQRQGLVENTRGGVPGNRKAWRLTVQGTAALAANRPLAWERSSLRNGLPTDGARANRSSADGARTGGPSVNGRATMRPGGPVPAARELERPAPRPAGAGAQHSADVSSGRPLGSALPADFRLTVRTQMALQAVAQSSARGATPSNLQVAARIGVSGKSTVSKLMSRLQQQGLVENTRGDTTKGLEKAWRLTSHGQAVLDAHHPAPRERTSNPDDPAELSGGKLVPKRARSRRTPARPASDRFRLTVRTHLVLTAVAEHPGASNRKVANAAGVRDEGQISKLLARLQDRGLIRDTANPTSSGYAKSWQLTPQGEALLHANRPLTGRAA